MCVASTCVATSWKLPVCCEQCSMVFFPSGKTYHANGAPAYFHFVLAKRTSEEILHLPRGSV